MTTEYQKDYTLLRPFDVEAAKSGEDICGYNFPEEGFTYVAGPDKADEICYLDDNGYLNVYDIDYFRMKPLCWVEGKPVYKGDVLYNKIKGFNDLTYCVSGVNKFGHVISSPKGSGNIEAPSNLTWTKPVKKEKVKRKAWINVYRTGAFVHETEADANFNALSNRIDCVETEIEYEVEVK